jgi:hypothetical protein
VRIRVTVSRSEAGYAVEFSKPDGTPIATRTMAAWTSPPHVGPASVPEGDLSEPVARLARALPRHGDVETVGRHLFDSMIGTEAWTTIRDAATGAKSKCLELALEWDPGESVLHAAHWEAMHDGTRFLAAHPPPLTVTVTRLVRGASGSGGRTVRAPARVLFAVGSSLGDPSVRAGAEILGLLRSIESEQRGVTSSVLQSASLASLAAAVARFRPDVVHLISHGRVRDGRGELLLRPDESQDAEDPPVPVRGDALLKAVRSEAGLPALAVITGCESGSPGDPERPLETQHTAPLAVELVAGGIPAVIGMTGRVADRACRLFTRRFGTVLAAGRPLVAAVAEGRGAGLYGSGDPADRADWALPALYLAEDVAPDYAPVDDAAQAAIAARIGSYELQGDPVFCGRRRFMEQLERVLGPGELQALVAYTDGKRAQIGKTRLIHEMARHALRDGHVVVMVPAKGALGSGPPTRVGALAAELLYAIGETRRRFGLAFDAGSEILAQIEAASGTQLGIDEVEEERRMSRLTTFLTLFEGELQAVQLREALAFDLKQLIGDARASGDPAITAGSKALVLLDSVDRWDIGPGGAAEALFGTLVTGTGLGVPGEDVPVVMTCALNDLGGDAMAAELERSASERWKRWERLGPFAEDDGEDRLAYEWVLLNPRPNLPWDVAANVHVPADPDGDWIDVFRMSIEGVPGNLSDKSFYSSTLAFVQAGVFLADDDDKALDDYLELLA